MSHKKMDQTHSRRRGFSPLWQCAVLLMLGSNLASAETVLSPEPPQKKAKISPSAFQDIPLADLPRELQDKRKWNALKQLWKALDKVLPRDGKQTVETEKWNDNSPYIDPYPKSPGDFGSATVANPLKAPPAFFVRLNHDFSISGIGSRDIPHYSARQYYQVLSPTQADAFLKRLQAIFNTDRPLSLSPASRLLYQLTALRIDALSTSSRQTTEKFQTVVRYPRMIPFEIENMQASYLYPSFYLVKTIDRLQKRGNMLAQLRKRKLISSKVYQESLDAMQKEAELAIFLQKFAEYGFTFNYVRRDNTQGCSSPDFWEKLLAGEYAHLEKEAQRQGVNIDNPSVKSFFESIPKLSQDLEVLKKEVQDLPPLMNALEAP